MVADLPEDAPRIDARGMVVMPGAWTSTRTWPGRRSTWRAASHPGRAGIPSSVPTIPRSGSGGIVPSTFVTGYRYAQLGYTTVVERRRRRWRRGTRSSSSRHADGRHGHLRAPRRRRACSTSSAGPGAAARVLAWGLDAAGATGSSSSTRVGLALERGVGDVGSRRRGAGVTPREVLAAMPAAVDGLGLPHPVHVIATTWVSAATEDRERHSRPMEGRRAHLATSSSTRTAASPAGSCARARRSWPSTWASTPSSAPTSGR